MLHGVASISRSRYPECVYFELNRYTLELARSQLFAKQLATSSAYQPPGPKQGSAFMFAERLIFDTTISCSEGNSKVVDPIKLAR